MDAVEHDGVEPVVGLRIVAGDARRDSVALVVEPMRWSHPAGGNCTQVLHGHVSQRRHVVEVRHRRREIDSSPFRCRPCIGTSPGIASGSGIVRVVTRQAAPTFACPSCPLGRSRIVTVVLRLDGTKSFASRSRVR
ncbi:hypothetical protein [Rhodococcus koreensis]